MIWSRLHAAFKAVFYDNLSDICMSFPILRIIVRQSMDCVKLGSMDYPDV